jgi:polysaccharide deacetylase family protein (PEP-CTERM system associated)
MSGVLNALSIDVEDYFHASALQIPAGEWATQEQRATGNTVELLDILRETGTKATFFVLGWLAERHPALVRAIAGEGHEIACHGYSHQLIYRQSRAEFFEETRRAKQILEDITGEPVRGYRAASFSITAASTWALDVIAELGFTYDSSIFPIYHDRYGIRDASTKPHVLVTPEGREIAEIPPTVLELGRLRLPVAGGGYLRLYPYGLTRWAIRRINRSGCPVVVYLHPWEIDPDQPEPKVGVVTRFRHTVNIRKMKSRLRRLLADFRFAPMYAVGEEWFAAHDHGSRAGSQNGIDRWATGSRSS